MQDRLTADSGAWITCLSDTHFLKRVYCLEVMYFRASEVVQRVKALATKPD